MSAIKDLSRLFSLISKDYAEDLFKVLVNYTDISASEAASRLELHIKTVQEFLEVFTEAGYLEKEEVIDKKRPYFRYRLIKKRIRIDIDLEELINDDGTSKYGNFLIREKQDANVRYTTARYNSYISNVVIWIGSGREIKERKISLTIPQGKFLHHLPFPTADPLSIRTIMNKAGVGSENLSEILDIIELLIQYDVIEKKLITRE